ncbi:MAG TPA: sigma-54 dependent transcriptional regulator, partial [Kofleriaceae bacterium]|nr:sigma-54 dependent transcriptional regulator [Kofleriaceae bacterium]
MRTEAILLVDDDPAIVLSLALLLKQSGYRTVSAAGPREAIDVLARGGVRLVLSDMNFSRATTGEEGLELLATIRARWPKLPVILMTAWGSIALAVRGVRAGALDFITKPWTHQQVLGAVRTALDLASQGSSPDRPPSRGDLDARFDFAALVGKDPRFLKVLEVAGRVAATDAAVLITGESGTGKELVAHALHRTGRRAAGPFVAVNCAAIPEPLLESELFGHAKGAFTDARQRRAGLMAQASGGTLFLDEIGDMPLGLQPKLLRALQEKKLRPVGGDTEVPFDARIVAASNRDLETEVEEKRFREDLFYRINV